MEDYGMGAAQWSHDRMEPRGGFYGEEEPEPALEPYIDKWEEEIEEKILQGKWDGRKETNGNHKHLGTT